jgi:hypothetical protein
VASYGKVSASALDGTRPFPDGIAQLPPRTRPAEECGEDDGASHRAVPRTTWEVAARLNVPSLTGTDGGASVVAAARPAVGSPMFWRRASACADSHSASPITKAIGPCRPNLIATEHVPNIR